ncbi:MAG: ABC-2 family transporter protein [Nanoarchaeota archaeon]|nr:ABC-2 family transporter protein [Nanoarchaeota archaeon]
MLTYLKEGLVIKLKEFTEYKANSYTGLFFSIIYLISLLTFGLIFLSNFQDLLGWSKINVLFFVVISGFFATLGGIFSFGLNLKGALLEGTFNSYLNKPVNVWFQFQIKSIVTSFLGPFIFYTITLLSLIIIYSELFLFLNILKFFVFGFLGMLFFILTFHFFVSIHFFMKEATYFLRSYLLPQRMFDMFPAIIFKGNLKIFSYFFANVFYGVYATQVLFDLISFEEFIFLLSLLIIINIVLIFGIYFMWKKGLEKYEAFG